MGPLQNEVGVLMTEDTEEVELLNVTFASGFNAKASPQSLEVREKV